VAKLIALILPLGLDTLAVAAALGMAGLPARQRVRVSVLFTVFEAAMPLLGLGLGRPLGRAIGGGADYAAIALLVGFGLYTLLGDEKDETRKLASALERGALAAFALGLSISLDELAIGFTLGLLGVSVVAVIIAIATQAFIVTQLGLALGTRMSLRARESAERLAGLSLAAVGLVLLAEKLLS
jgi:putative Mn2+ efflux pump MntP